MPSEERYALVTHAKLVGAVASLDEDAREFFEERAGILEFEAGYTRPQAEQLAWNETQRYLKRRGDPGVGTDFPSK